VKNVWMGVAGVCGVIAMVALIRHDFDTAFILAAVGAVTWFLSYRVQIRDQMGSDDRQDSMDEVEANDEEES
jgi:hypothetical protein